MTKQMLVRTKKASIDPRYGKSPDDRSSKELLRDGLIIIDKPMGPTSHQVTAWAREILGVEKAAHGGTLDPRVTGVLPIGFGSAVRAMDYLHDAGKRYIGVMKLHGDVDEADVQKIAGEFTGEIYQTPPVRSAVRRSMRRRKIYSIEILEMKGRNLLLDVRCEGGTYMRTLLADMGEALAVGAHMQDLRRVGSGGFTEEEAFSLHTLRDAAEYYREGDEAELLRILRPVEDIFSDWERVVIKDSAVDALCHGADLALPGIVELSKSIEIGSKVAVFSLKGEIVSTGTASLNAQSISTEKDGVAIKLDRVFMKPGTYPRIWSSRS